MKTLRELVFEKVYENITEGMVTTAVENYIDNLDMDEVLNDAVEYHLNDNGLISDAVESYIESSDLEEMVNDAISDMAEEHLEDAVRSALEGMLS